MPISFPKKWGIAYTGSGILKVVVHMPRIDGALVSAEKPALDQCGNAVNTWQRFMGRDLGSKDDVWIVLEPIVLQRCVNSDFLIRMRKNAK